MKYVKYVNSNNKIEWIREIPDNAFIFDNNIIEITAQEYEQLLQDKNLNEELDWD